MKTQKMNLFFIFRFSIHTIFHFHLLKEKLHQNDENEKKNNNDDMKN